MQLHSSQRKAAAELRTLESMAADLLKFRTVCKGHLSRAKEANNVIEEPFFDIPLDQVTFQ